MRDEKVAEGIARLEGVLHRIEDVLAEAQQQARRLLQEQLKEPGPFTVTIPREEYEDLRRYQWAILCGDYCVLLHAAKGLMKSWKVFARPTPEEEALAAAVRNIRDNWSVSSKAEGVGQSP
jgi:hypothetical protein